MARGKAISQKDKNRAIEALRSLNKSLSQTEISKLIGVDQSSISGILRGKQQPGKSTAEKILKVKLEDLLKAQPATRAARKKEKLPSRRASKRKKDDEFDERSGDIHCLPRRSREQRRLLIQPAQSQDPAVTKLPKFKRLELELQNEARLLAGHNQIIIKVYSCLSCRRKFESVGDRTCGKCKGDTVTMLSGYEVH